jgi:hypothetical protein
VEGGLTCLYVQTLTALTDLYDNICHAAGKAAVPCIVLGNKCDLDPQVSKESVREWMRSMRQRKVLVRCAKARQLVLLNLPQVNYVEVSAKSGVGIPEAFTRAASIATNTSFEGLPKPPERELSVATLTRRRSSVNSFVPLRRGASMTTVESPGIDQQIFAKVIVTGCSR